MGSMFSRRADSGTSSTKNDTTTTSADRDKLLTSWNIAAAATVLLPIFFFLIARLSNGFGGEDGRWWGGGGNEGEGSGGWWGGGNEGEGWGSWERGPEDEGKGALAVVYIWSLIIFALLVWRGNKVLQNNKDMRALFAALFVFANLAFLCSILVGGLGMQEEGGEEGRLNSFSAVMLLTYVFWTIFGVAFAAIFYWTIRKPSASSSFFGTSSDYQRQDDGGII